MDTQKGTVFIQTSPNGPWVEAEWDGAYWVPVKQGITVENQQELILTPFIAALKINEKRQSIKTRV